MKQLTDGEREILAELNADAVPSTPICTECKEQGVIVKLEWETYPGKDGEPEIHDVYCPNCQMEYGVEVLDA